MATFRSVMSVCDPAMRVALPEASRTATPRASIQRYSPPLQRLERAVLLERIADGPLQNLGIDLTFDQIVGRAGLHRRNVDVAVALTGEQDDRAQAAGGARLAQNFQAVVLAEAVVDEINVMLPLAHRLGRLVERGDPTEAKAGSSAVGEKIAGEDVIVFVVFDQQ